VSRILVSVGTDHHPFQRLVDWADSFAARHPEHEVFVQYGSARPPAHCEHSSLLDHSELQSQIARAEVVICHGGPATITDARRSGLVPICVPRDPAHGEHVDGHQLRFAARIAEGGLVDRHTDVAELDDAVATALTRARMDPDSVGQVPEGVRAVGAQISALLAGSRQALKES
jgi:UDP-N-acetylglucosamine transferase subunit ALG13